MDGFPAQLYAVKSKDMYRLLKDFRSDPAVESCYAFGEWLHLTTREDKNGNGLIDRLAAQYQAEDFESMMIKPSIEDSFIRLMQEKQKTEPLNNNYES